MNMEWQEIINIESLKDYYITLKKYVDEEYKTKNIFPPRNMVFNALNHTKFDDVKVVIIGQDPYHELGQAMGLSFSVPKGIKLPPSLVNIYKEIESDLGIKKDFKNGDLTSWANQGVLLLNSILTVEEGHALSHKNKGWEIFTDNIIKLLNEDTKPKVFILWGNYANSKSSLITNKSHLVLKSVHPSPLSAYNGFFGCKHFSKTNEFLKEKYKKIINW